MIHIVFQYSDIEALKKAFDLDPGFRGDVVQIEDDYAVGPLGAIYNQEGIEARRNWWLEVSAGTDLEARIKGGQIGNDNAAVEEIKRRLSEDPQEVLWIWAAQNKHDVSGYYWLVSQLKDFQGRVFILYLNNLPFINEKGQVFYPVNLFQIPPREFLKARKLARLVTPSEFEVDPDEWQRLCKEGKAVRILEGGKKLVQYDYDYYDSELKKFISGDWIKAHKLVGQFLGKAKETTGDIYLLWRLKLLIAAGEIDAQGELKGLRDFEIKNRSDAPITEPAT
jgi:hypothetical protein